MDILSKKKIFAKKFSCLGVKITPGAEFTPRPKYPPWSHLSFEGSSVKIGPVVRKLLRIY